MFKYLKYIAIVIVFSFITFLNSCDVVEGDYEKIVEIDTNASKPRLQNILITEYTGHKCGNCPPAAEEAKRLQKLYAKGRVIFMAIHAGDFAKPDASYPNDLRAKEGYPIMNSFGITLQPIGDINRILNGSGQRTFAYSEWSSVISTNIEKESPCIIKFENAEYNSETRKINAKINIEYFDNVTTSDNIAVYIVEDSIVSPQKLYIDQTEKKLTDYVHYGVLRGTMNGAWGDLISSSADISPKKGDKYDFDFNFTIPEGKTWRPNHIRLIAMVHDNNKSFVISQVKDTELTIK